MNTPQLDVTHAARALAASINAELEARLAHSYIDETLPSPAPTSSTLTYEMVCEAVDRFASAPRLRARGWWMNLDFLRGRWFSFRGIEPGESFSMPMPIRRIPYAEFQLMYPSRLGVITSIDEPPIPRSTCKCVRHNPPQQRSLFA